MLFKIFQDIEKKKNASALILLGQCQSDTKSEERHNKEKTIDQYL